MPGCEMEKMTWKEIDALDRQKTIVLLPMGPIEEHGPHLPVGTDFLAATAISRQAVSLLEREAPDLNILLHPGIPLGSAGITEDFPGTISLKAGTLADVIYDVAVSFARHGFRFLVIVNHHYDLYHMKAISVAIERISRKHNLAVYEPLGTAFFASSPEPALPFIKGQEVDLEREGHAEFEETSFIQYQYPELLRDSWRSLPPVYIGLPQQYLLGRRTLKKMGAGQGYVGTPDKASPEYGKAYLEAQARKVADGALKLYRGEDLPQLSLKIRLVQK